MSRAYERAAHAYARHMARSPQSALLERLTTIDERLHLARLALRRADGELVGRLAGVRADLTAAAARIGAQGEDPQV